LLKPFTAQALKKAISSLLLAQLLLPSLALGLQGNSAAYAASTPTEKTVTLPAGTPVTLALTEEISSKTASNGMEIPFQVLSDVEEEDTVLIKAGTLGHAQVTNLKKPAALGKEGELTISDFYVTAVDGQRVPLVASLSQVGEGKSGKSLALGLIICWPLLLMKGGHAVVPAGTQKTVYTAGKVKVKI
jgi:hypothetical protein